MTDIYQQRSKLKIILSALGLIILLVTIVYSNYLANSLKESELKNSIIYKNAVEYLLNNEDYNADVSNQEEIRQMFALPTIFKSDVGTLIGINFGPEKDQDSTFLVEKVREFEASGQIPLKSNNGGIASEMYFFNSPLLDYIRYYPFVQLLLVASFILLGFYFFNASRKSEQNRVWVGMAKETAHQLGTPISAIIAWIEHLKTETSLDAEQAMVVEELKNDVNRLELVADRFSKIGSEPELKTHNLNNQLSDMVEYMSRRAARKVKFAYTPPSNPIYVNINGHLFDWVIENLIRNSLDSMNGEGLLSLVIKEDQKNAIVLISDTGRGIPSGKFKTIFQPGYSTKKRGWGLGLSLSKRIIEQYHGGHIYVKESTPNEITTFSITLPLVKED